MKNRRQFRVAGHTAVGAGWALCSCGASSPVLPSQGKRQKWMREMHKPQVLERREAMT